DGAERVFTRGPASAALEGRATHARRGGAGRGGAAVDGNAPGAIGAGGIARPRFTRQQRDHPGDRRRTPAGCAVTPLTGRSRVLVLVAAVGGLVFDGVELGLMPVASQSVTKSLVGPAYTKDLGGEWFAWYTAALMLGAALGGLAFGWA